jgi:hypothetical protein
MAAPPRRWDESDILDVVHSFKNGEKVAAIARELSEARGHNVSRHRVVALLQQALRDELVSTPTFGPKEVTEKLQERFDGVRFRVLSSRLRFPQLAAQQVLEWVKEECQGRDNPFVAVGGGQTMGQLIEQVPKVLRALDNGDPLKQWFAAAPLTFINATAGDQPRRPELGASFLTCRFAQALSEGCGGKAAARAALHSASLFLAKDEIELVREALQQTRLVVSGVGAPESAYCIAAIKEKGLLAPSEHDPVVGEILFHLFDRQGRAIDIPRTALGVKRGLEEVSKGAAEAPEGAGPPRRGAARGRKGDGPPRPPESPLLVTLFDFEDLRGRPTRDGRSVAVVANCTAENKKEKAAALYVLLKSEFLTHVCLSTELARHVLDTARSWPR